MDTVADDRTRRRGRARGVTPRHINPEQVVRVAPNLVKVGYLLHDGMVLDVDITHSVETGEPVTYTFETPHALIVADPDSEVYVYGRVDPDAATALKDAYEQTRHTGRRVG